MEANKLIYSKFLSLQKMSNRIYSVNRKKFVLKKDIIDRLIYYNKSPTGKNNVNIDKTYVELLILSAFSVHDLKMCKIDNDILDVIKGNLLCLFDI